MVNCRDNVIKGRSEKEIEAYHLIEFAVLHHHGVNNPKETLIRRKYCHATSQSIALHEALTHMFAQDLDDTTVFCLGVLIPLEVSVGMLEGGFQFVALQLVGRE